MMQKFPSRPFASEIVGATAAHLKTSRGELLSLSRLGRLPYGRHLAWWLCLELTGLSMAEIGRRVGARHHTTVLHGLRRIRAGLAEGGQTERDVEAIRSAVLAEAHARRAAVQEAARKPLEIYCE